jgi:hypothetical protein
MAFQHARFGLFIVELQMGFANHTKSFGTWNILGDISLSKSSKERGEYDQPARHEDKRRKAGTTLRGHAIEKGVPANGERSDKN